MASLVPDGARLGFLPKHFGSRRYLKGENAVYNWMGALCPDYRGGYWEFLELSNGSFYMRPTDCPPRACPPGAGSAALRHRMLVRVESNGFEGDVSADAAGIIATLFAAEPPSMRRRRRAGGQVLRAARVRTASSREHLDPGRDRLKDATMNAITLDFSCTARKLHFNTERWYTTHGQRLAVWVVPSVGKACYDAACFVDFDRDITGYFPIQVTGNFDTPAALARHVVRMYDQSQYRLGAFQGIDEHIRAVRALGYEAFVAQSDAHEVRRADLAL